MILEGRSWDCVDWESVKRSALEGAVMGAIGGAVGGVLHKAVQAGKIAKRVAWMIGAAYDVGAGTAWDMVAYGRSPSEAFTRNLLTFGIGAAAGAVAGAAFRRVGETIRAANNRLHAAGRWFAHNFDMSAVTSGGLPVRRNDRWVTELINNRVVRSPGDINPEAAVDAVYRRLRAQMGSSELKLHTIAVMEVSNKLYLGFNRTLDQNLRGLSDAGYDSLRRNIRDGYVDFEPHAEQWALLEYFLDSDNVGRVGRMFSNREVCPTCLSRDARSGGVVYGVLQAGLERLELTSTLNTMSVPTESRFPGYLQAGRVEIIVDANGWRIG